MPKDSSITFAEREEAADLIGAIAQVFRQTSASGEGDFLRELVRALRVIRYGSIVLTIHDGRIVEIQKTERIRRNGNTECSASTIDKSVSGGSKLSST